MSTSITKKKKPFWTDPFAAEVRRIRDEHAKQFNYNFDAIFDDLLQKQEAMKKQGAKFITQPLNNPLEK